MKPRALQIAAPFLPHLVYLSPPQTNPLTYTKVIDLNIKTECNDLQVVCISLEYLTNTLFAKNLIILLKVEMS